MLSPEEKLLEAIGNDQNDENNSEIERILSHKVNLNFIDKDGNTPLMLASEIGYLAALELLLKHKADVNFYGREPDSSQYTQTPLITASIEGHVDVVTALLDGGADPNLKPPVHDSPIILAATNKHFDVVRLLVDRGADPNEKDIYTSLDLEKFIPCFLTPLHYAVEEKDVRTIVYLLRKGADPNQQDCYGYTPLHIACKYNDSETAQILVLFGANLDIQDENGNTALHYACEKGNIAISQLLISLGARLEIEDGDGETPLLEAFSSESTEMLSLLVEAGSDLNHQDMNGCSILHAVAANGDEWIDMLELLLKQLGRVNIAITDNDGNTPLDLANIYNKNNSHRYTIELLQMAITPSPVVVREQVAKITKRIAELNIGGIEQPFVKPIGKKGRAYVNILKNQTPALQRTEDLKPDLPVPERVIKSAEYIVEHASRRIDFCFYIMVHFYYKRLKIMLGNTELQHGQGKGEKGTFTQACHSAFVNNPIGFINCYSVNGQPLTLALNWDDSNQFYNNLNSTVELPAEVNKFDSSLEGPIGNPTEWRKEFLKILNQVSFGIKDPIVGLNDFYKIMQDFFNSKRKEYFVHNADNTKKVIYSLQYKGTFSGWDEIHKSAKQSYINSLLQINDNANLDVITQLHQVKQQVQRLYETKFSTIKTDIESGKVDTKNAPIAQTVLQGVPAPAAVNLKLLTFAQLQKIVPPSPIVLPKAAVPGGNLISGNPTAIPAANNLTMFPPVIVPPRKNTPPGTIVLPKAAPPLAKNSASGSPTMIATTTKNADKPLAENLTHAKR